MKGIDSLFEIVGGFLLLTPVKLGAFLNRLSQHELYADHEKTAKGLQHAAARVAEASPLAAIYLIVHGLAKVILIWAVFKQKRWGYFGLIGLLSFFSIVEIVQGVRKSDWFTLGFAALDLLIVFLIAKEYRSRKDDLT